jgi:hypothetical protein
MKIVNVTEIYDNGEFVTVVTKSGTVTHLPLDGVDCITIVKNSPVTVQVELKD